MLRKEAQALVGQTVSAWAAMNGVYVGTLLEVFGSPWRGKVRITGILEPAFNLERGQVCRRGFRPGEEIEVGGANIKATQAEGLTSYLDVLKAAIAQHEAVPVESMAGSRHAWVHPALIKALETVVKAEERRLQTGEWKLVG